MKGISVELLDYMGSDLTITNVARVSFNKWKEEFDSKDERLINYLAEHEHTSPFRHNSIQIRCKAPIFLARQLMKHQVGLSWNEISRRYVDTDIEFFEPEQWRSRPKDGIKQGSGENVVDITETKKTWFGAPDRLDRMISEVLDSQICLYKEMLDRGVAPEMARMVLPQSMLTDWVWTGSLQAFYHVYRLRSGEGSQKEAQVFAKKLEQVIEPLFPKAWVALKKGE